jgi:hypothetical protein
VNSSTRRPGKRHGRADPHAAPLTPAPGQAGLAAGLLNTSAQLGIALGLAIFSALATSRSNHLLAAHAARPDAFTSGYARALLASSIFLAAAALIGLRTTNSRGEEPQQQPDAELALEAVETSGLGVTGERLPLRGVVVAYALGQLVSAIPILPGGGGTVEATTAAGLVVAGGATTAVVTAVLLYRVIGFTSTHLATGPRAKHRIEIAPPEDEA